MNNTTEYSNLTASEDDTVPSGIDAVQLIGIVLFFTFTVIGLASNIALIGIHIQEEGFDSEVQQLDAYIGFF